MLMIATVVSNTGRAGRCEAGPAVSVCRRCGCIPLTRRAALLRHKEDWLLRSCVESLDD